MMMIVSGFQEPHDNDDHDDDVEVEVAAGVSVYL